MKHLLLIFLMFVGCAPTEEEYVCLEGECCTEIDGECYHNSDLDVLENFIELNSTLFQISSLEIGTQIWDNGRLIFLTSRNRF